MYNVKKVGMLSSSPYSGVEPNIPHPNVFSYVTSTDTKTIVGTTGFFLAAISRGEMSPGSIAIATCSDGVLYGYLDVLGNIIEFATV